MKQIIEILKIDHKGDFDANCKNSGFKRSALYDLKSHLNADPTISPTCKNPMKTKGYSLMLKKIIS